MLDQFRRTLRPYRVWDIGGDERASILIAGSGRSGTTWFGSAVARIAGARNLFEPFLLDRTGELGLLKSSHSDLTHIDFDSYLYMSTPEDSPKHHHEIKRIINGDIYAEWVDHQTRPGLYRRRVIKDVKANLLLPYFCRYWKDLRVIFIARNVFRVVELQLHMTQRQKACFGENYTIISPGPLDGWLSERMVEVAQATTLVEKLAHKWCIENAFPLRHGIHIQPNVRFVRYEDLLQGPEAWASLEGLLDIGALHHGRFRDALSRPSSVSRTASMKPQDASAAQARLSKEEISTIERVVAGYPIFSQAALASEFADLLTPPADWR